MNTKKRIYIDLDGVILDLIGQINIELGTTCKICSDHPLISVELKYKGWIKNLI